jgi:hypothetical protein
MKLQNGLKKIKGGEIKMRHNPLVSESVNSWMRGLTAHRRNPTKIGDLNPFEEGFYQRLLLRKDKDLPEDEKRYSKFSLTVSYVKKKYGVCPDVEDIMNELSPNTRLDFKRNEQNELESTVSFNFSPPDFQYTTKQIESWVNQRFSKKGKYCLQEIKPVETKK